MKNSPLIRVTCGFIILGVATLVVWFGMTVQEKRQAAKYKHDAIQAELLVHRDAALARSTAFNRSLDIQLRLMDDDIGSDEASDLTYELEQYELQELAIQRLKLERFAEKHVGG